MILWHNAGSKQQKLLQKPGIFEMEIWSPGFCTCGCKHLEDREVGCFTENEILHEHWQISRLILHNLVSPQNLLHKEFDQKFDRIFQIAIVLGFFLPSFFCKLFKFIYVDTLHNRTIVWYILALECTVKWMKASEVLQGE